MNALVLVNEDEEIHLHGAGVSAPLRGAKRLDCVASDGGWLERVEIYFEGLPGAIRDARAAIERLLASDDTRLRLQPYPGAEVLEARLAAASCQTLAWNNGGGVSAARLELLRARAWQGAESELALNGASGGLVIYGHADDGHRNTADVSATQLAGDCPGNLRLEITNAGSGEIPGDVLVGLDAGADPFQPGRQLEGEDASGGSLVTPAGCSGGAARQVEANTTGGALLAWVLDAGLLAWLGGRETRPVARLSSAPPVGKVWAWWQLRAGEMLVWKSEMELLGSENLLDLPALPLPPAPLSDPAGLTLELCGKTTGGTAAMSVDFVHLSPLDGWRRYRAAGALPAGATLVDDGLPGGVYMRGAAGQVSSYAAAGAPLRLRPGRDQRLYLLHNGGLDAPLEIRAWYRPAWGSL